MNNGPSFVTAPKAVSPAPERWPSFLRALAAPDGALLGTWLDQHGLSERDVRWLWHQRLAAFAYHRLRECDQLSLIEPRARRRLEEISRSMAIEDALHFRELQCVLSTLTNAGVESILMKGASLAHTVYPTPRWASHC